MTSSGLKETISTEIGIPYNFTVSGFKVVLEKAQYSSNTVILPWKTKIISGANRVLKNLRELIFTLNTTEIGCILERITDSKGESEYLVNCLVQMVLLMSSSVVLASRNGHESSATPPTTVTLNQDILKQFVGVIEAAMKFSTMCRYEIDVLSKEMYKQHQAYIRNILPILLSNAAPADFENESGTTSSESFNNTPDQKNDNHENTWMLRMSSKDVFLHRSNLHSTEEPFKVNLPTGILQADVKILEAFITQLKQILSKSQSNFEPICKRFSIIIQSLNHTVTTLVSILKDQKKLGRLRLRVCGPLIISALVKLNNKFLEAIQVLLNVKRNTNYIIGVVDILADHFANNKDLINPVFDILMESRIMQNPWYWPLKSWKIKRVREFRREAAFEASAFLYEISRKENDSDCSYFEMAIRIHDDIMEIIKPMTSKLLEEGDAEDKENADKMTEALEEDESFITFVARMDEFIKSATNSSTPTEFSESGQPKAEEGDDDELAQDDNIETDEASKSGKMSFSHNSPLE